MCVCVCVCVWISKCKPTCICMYAIVCVNVFVLQYRNGSKVKELPVKSC